MNKVLWSMLLVLTLSACGTTGSTPATVEDRTGGTAGTTASGAESTGVGTAGVAGSTLPGGAGDPRKDPASPLSKRSVHFDFDSFVVKDEYRPMLEAHAGYLKSKRDARVILQGNADERGSREYNLALGQKRAEAVVRSLALLGAGEQQLEAVSFGEERPAVPGSDEDAWSRNRRAELKDR